MDSHDIRTLIAYNEWANARILAQAARLSPEQYAAPAPVPHGSLRGTLAHALAAEVVWRRRWQGDSPTALLREDDLPDFAALRERWEREAQALRDFIMTLTDDDLARAVDYKTTRGQPMQEVLWRLIAHVVNHGTQHRSEAAILLTSAGCSPGDLDLVVFLRSRASHDPAA